MKTLDEVITEHEDDWLFDEDALHYLKEYRACGQCAYADRYLRCTQETDNPALTWDELKQMEGKPVWIEEKYSFSEDWHGSWEVINSVWDDKFDDDPYIAMTDEEYRHKDDLGERWKAYRKERE